MHSKRFPNVMFGTSLRPESAALAIMVMLLFPLFVPLFITLTAQPVQAQTYTVIYNFTGGLDGTTPVAGLTMDRASNLYGTTLYGGGVFKLAHNDFGWALTPLHGFVGGNDGASPHDRVTIGLDGSLYSTTWYGGSGGMGVIFKVRPSPTACLTALCGWTESILYAFQGGSDGGGMYNRELVFDDIGSLYGATGGGAYGAGYVYKLVPSQGNWTKTILYDFQGSPDGAIPSGVAFDKTGKLYGTTMYGGAHGWGTVFQLTPSESGWTEKVLYNFRDESDGFFPYAPLAMDNAGNLYGSTLNGGSGGGGTIFMLTPSNGDWVFTLLYSITGSLYSGPSSKLAIDAAGNVYGTTRPGGCYRLGVGTTASEACTDADQGSVFELSPGGGGWTYTLLHDFTGGSDGGNPEGGVIVGRNGNLYGTAAYGGTAGAGVVFEITQ